MNVDIGIGISRSRVDEFSFGIDGGRRPDGRACRPIHLGSDLALVGGFGRIEYAVSLPVLLAGIGVQRNQAAAEGTALVLRRAARTFLERGHWHEQAAIIEYGRARDAGCRMILYARFPD